MNHRLFRLVLALYPSWWRQRYRTEVEAILEQSDSTLRSVIDLLRSALDAWTCQRPPQEAFARFSDQARNVIVLAQKEAHALRHNYLGTEHILLGLFAEPEGASARTLRSFGISPERVRSRLIEVVGQGFEWSSCRRDRRTACSELPKWGMALTPRTKRGFGRARAAADRLGDASVDDSHLLLGLLDLNEGVGAGILAEFVDAEHIRQRLAGLRAT
jgi:ATP-dependent Clp protease ATP-binding subunit ClpC